MCRAFYDRYGLSYVGLRYIDVYGPHQDQTAAYTGVIPIMLNKIDANEAPTINGDGTQAYDFIDVRDVARCNVLAMKSLVSDEFYNVGAGVQTSIAELCNKILELEILILRFPIIHILRMMLEGWFKIVLDVLKKQKRI